MAGWGLLDQRMLVSPQNREHRREGGRFVLGHLNLDIEKEVVIYGVSFQAWS
jgi:hypothetical protein